MSLLPSLWAGKTVVADRFLFTALARDVARGLDLDWVLNLLRRRCSGRTSSSTFPSRPPHRACG